MPEISDDIVKKIENTYEAVNEIKIVLKGYNGQEGLCKQVSDLDKKHDDLNGKFKLLCGILIGAGVLYGGSVGLLKLF